MTNQLRDKTWVHDLAFEVALKYFTPDQLCRRFDLSPEQFEAVLQEPVFLREVDKRRREIDESGEQFKFKARKWASLLLEDLAAIAADDTASHGDRIKAFAEIARMAGYGREDVQPQGNNAFQVNIHVGN